MARPRTKIHELTRNKISDETGHNTSEVSFSFDVPVSHATVNILGTSPTSGTVADSFKKTVEVYQDQLIGSPLTQKTIQEMQAYTVEQTASEVIGSETALRTVQDVREFPADHIFTGVIDHQELYQEGNNQVNIYGMSVAGEWTEYLRNYGLSFDAVDDVVTVTNHTSIQVIGSQTIEILMKPSTLSNRRNPYNKAYGGEGTITHETNGSFNYYWGTAGGNTSPYQGFNSGFTVGVDELAHIALVRDLTAMKLHWYKDGVLGRTASASYAEAVASNHNLLFGDGYTTNWGGEIYEIRLWNIARTSEEIDKFKNIPLRGDEPGLVGYWLFDKGGGSVATDYTANSNDGSIAGATWVTF